MHLIGRWEKVRQWGPNGWGLPWMLDWKTGALTPYACDEWWYDKKHQAWLPTVRGGIIRAGYEAGAWRFGLGSDAGSNTVTTTIALDSAYTFSSAGDAIGGRYVLLDSETLTAVYYRVTAYAGTAANVNDLNFELRNETSGLPGSTLHTSATHDPASATGWVSLTGLSFAMTAANSPYWAILGDADGNGSDFVTVQRAVSGMSIPEQLLLCQSSSTTDGWGTQSITGQANSLVLVFASGQTAGVPFSGGSLASNTNKKGWRIGGFTSPLTIIGLMVAQDVDYNRCEWWTGSSGPSGTATQTGTVRGFATTTAAIVSGMFFQGGLTLAAGETGHLVADSSTGGTTSYRRANIGTGEDATLRSAMLGGGTFYYAEANGTTSWSNDQVGSFPCGDLLLRDTVAAGGGGGAIYHGAMAGGLLR